MLCRFCQKPNSKVIDSRSSEGGGVIRRRRECVSCGRRFTTYERVESGVKLTIIKRDGSSEPYLREKLKHGLERACYKRGFTDEQIEELVDEVEGDLTQRYKGSVQSPNVGELAANRLRQFDAVAFVRFASVYKEFADVQEFVDAVSLARRADDDPDLEEGGLFRADARD
ncbi:MAG: transcriptional regulator NrdR [Planctomycetaceae bacterium]|nr:transcriptional regulator NrdR [Planctomycetaceae bacterium]